MQEILQENSDQPMDEREELERDFEKYLGSLSGRDIVNTRKIESIMYSFQRRLEELRNLDDQRIHHEQEEMRQYVKKEFSKHDFSYAGPTNYSLGRGPFRRPEIHNISFKSILKALSGIEGIELHRDGCCLYISYKGRTIEILDGYEPSHENIASLLNGLGVSREDVFLHNPGKLPLKLPQKLPHLKKPHVIANWVRRRGHRQRNELKLPYRIARHSPCPCEIESPSRPLARKERRKANRDPSIPYKIRASNFIVKKGQDGKFIHEDCGIAVE